MDRYVKEAKVQRHTMFHLNQSTEHGITFTTTDSIRVILPHQDATIISIQISNFMVKKVFMDTWSSVNVIFKDTFDSMGLPKEIITPSPQPICGFNNMTTVPYGSARLLVMEGISPTQFSFYAMFLIID